MRKELLAVIAKLKELQKTEFEGGRVPIGFKHSVEEQLTELQNILITYDDLSETEQAQYQILASAGAKIVHINPFTSSPYDCFKDIFKINVDPESEKKYKALRDQIKGLESSVLIFQYTDNAGEYIDDAEDYINDA
jgi:hypothetical protein